VLFANAVPTIPEGEQSAFRHQYGQEAADIDGLQSEPEVLAMLTWRSSVLHRDITEDERRSMFDLVDGEIAQFRRLKARKWHRGIFEAGSTHPEMFLAIRHCYEELTELAERRRETRLSEVATDDED
jgi:hypothetical protein